MRTVEESEARTFRAIDFVVFTVLFFISATVGLVFGCRDRKKQSVENYYFGERKIAPIPVAISIAVSFISAITVIGGPAEVYLYGNVFGWYAISLLVPTLIGVVYYVPLIHRLQVSSSYEYLELRYHRKVRIMASVLGIFNTTAYLAIAALIPSLALTAVTPLKLSWTIALTSFICTIYTTLGGMKGVIWTDVLQSVIMLTGMAVVFVRVVAAVGGIDSIQAAASRGGRDNFFTFDFDPRVRRSAIAIFIGGAVSASFEILCNQIFIQRWVSCKTVKSARLAVSLSTIPLLLFYSFAIGNGLGSYAYYEGCDPILSGQITEPDQLIPYLAVDVFYDTPGLPGLFVSAAFCGTLSTVSSGLNALSALGLIDFIAPNFPRLTARSKLIVSKGLTLIFGVLVMALAYALTMASSNAIQVTQVLAGYFAGPFLGVYIMGVTMPWMTSKITAQLSRHKITHSLRFRRSIQLKDYQLTTHLRWGQKITAFLTRLCTLRLRFYMDQSDLWHVSSSLTSCPYFLGSTNLHKQIQDFSFLWWTTSSFRIACESFSDLAFQSCQPRIQPSMQLTQKDAKRTKVSCSPIIQDTLTGELRLVKILRRPSSSSSYHQQVQSVTVT